jgi:hypothetical protein
LKEIIKSQKKEIDDLKLELENINQLNKDYEVIIEDCKTKIENNKLKQNKPKEKNNKEEEKNYNEDTKLRKNILSMIKPFSISPFSKSLKKSNFDFSKILGDEKINTPTENFFIDDCSSNFISNFYNPISRIE